ncbi:LuxR C-terminal-related transcriptional regulator [Streptomyces galilaeus]
MERHARRQAADLVRELTLLTRLPGLPVVWLLATREDDADVLGSVHTRLEHIRLTPLASSDLAAIAQDRLGHLPDERARRFLDASAGNPLLAIDVLDNLVRAATQGRPDTVPEEFGAAIARRPADLPDASRALVEVVSVGGRAPATQDALMLIAERVDPGPGRPLAAALDSGLITVTEQRVLPSHDLVREAVLTATPGQAVRSLHRRLAEHHLNAGQALPAAPHARAAATRGDVATARTLVDLGRQLGSGVYALDALIVQISIELLRGNTQAAADLLTRSGQLVDADDGVRDPGLTVMRGWLSAGRGDVTKAIEVLRPVAAGVVSSCGHWPLWPCWMGLFFEIGTAGADEAFSEIVVQIAELTAERNPGVASFEGVALSLRGRAKGDLAMLAESARVLARSPRPILRAYGADVYGRALLAAGQRDQALELLEPAWDDYHRMDARIYRDAVQRVMRDAGVRRAHWPTAGHRPETGWDSPTSAERRVARLIADGHSNRSAAGEPNVSVNTVGTHLRMVFSKLGVQSRVQLTNALHRAEPLAPSD